MFMASIALLPRAPQINIPVWVFCMSWSLEPVCVCVGVQGARARNVYGARDRDALAARHQRGGPFPCLFSAFRCLSLAYAVPFNALLRATNEEVPFLGLSVPSLGYSVPFSATWHQVQPWKGRAARLRFGLSNGPH